MKNHFSHISNCIVLSLICIGASHGSDLRFLKPGSDADLIATEEKDICIVATEAVVSTLNELLHSNDKSEKSYRRYFGVEPPGRFDELRSKNVSGFLNHLFATLTPEVSSPSNVSLRFTGKDFCWKLGQTGDYTSYAAMISLQGSRYKSAIILFRLETLNSLDLPGVRIASVKPSGFFVSLK